MKNIGRLLVLCLLIGAYALARGQQPSGQHTILFKTDEKTYSIPFSYIISGKGQVEKVGAHSFSYLTPREQFIIRFGSVSDADLDRQQRIRVTSTNTDTRNAILAEGEYLIFTPAASQSGSVRMSFNLELGGGQVLAADRALTINFLFKEPQQAPPRPIKETVPPPPVKQERPETIETPSKPAVAQEPAPKSESEREWEAVKKMDSMDPYCTYCKKYPSSPYSAEALQRCKAFSPMGVQQENEGETSYRFLITNVTATPEIKTGSGVILSEEVFSPKKFTFTFLATVHNPDSASLEICDGAKESRKAQPCLPTIFPGNLLRADWSWNQGRDTLIFQMSGGLKPYRLFFKLDGFDVFIRDSVDTEELRLAVTDLERQLVQSGNYEVEVGDGSNFTFKKIPGKTIPIQKTYIRPEILRILASVLGLIMLLVIIAVVVRAKRKKQQLAYYKQVKENREPELHPENDSAPIEESIPQQEEPNSPIHSENPVSITKKNSSQIGFEPYHDFISRRSSFPYLALSMNALWEDSVLDKIFLHRDCIFDLQKYLWEHSTVKILEMESNIAEIGGMLVGKYTQNTTLGRYCSSIEKFVPIRAQEQSVYHLKFSPQSLAIELGKVQDEFPDLKVVGWFHTHPGHGLFLSQADLNVHVHFPEPFQFAMEIDSLTGDLDTGFFTKKMNGDINNTKNMKKHASWFAWTEIEKFTRSNR